MTYTFIGKDPESDVNGCPAVWVDDNRRLLVQGLRAGEDAQARTAADSPRAEDETLIVLESRMIPLLKEAIRVAESG
ncbi:hypothetical protein DWB77_04630 [Streptomyces hundungensis]|uniref:Uncharacterized protein n=1 Tax=Streptomyces hundungensis TaxID=1077946 RepID=A0A387HG94_9ACTN|nr:hypothetical protein [Streptomyces hundungensis]AYG82454.1 hypothetical protein DWB77_04630 [Streptomyces hundungensis]